MRLGRSLSDWHEDLQLTMASSPSAVVAWFADRGYGAIPAGVPGCPTFGVLFARGNEPVRLAAIGQWLRYDGSEVSVL